MKRLINKKGDKVQTMKVRKTIFHYDDDGGGDVIIIRGKKEFTIPFEDLIDLVAEYVRMQKLIKLEAMTSGELLLGLLDGGGDVIGGDVI